MDATARRRGLLAVAPMSGRRIRRRPGGAVLLESPSEPGLAEALRAGTHPGLTLERVLPLPARPAACRTLVECLARGGVSLLLVAGPAEALGAEALVRAEQLGLRVLALESPSSAWLRRPAPVSLARLPWFPVPRLLPRRLALTIKRTLDLSLALLALAALALPLLALGALVRATSPGPALYRQTRVGRDGRHFTIHKLRTMVEAAERDSGPVLARAGDPRLTPLGRRLKDLGLDELPQLWNVVRGQMSLVGPRPERPELVGGFHHAIPEYGLRHLVRPGLTGPAQLAGDYRTSPDYKLRADLWYVGHVSLRTDLGLMARTPLTILRRLRPAARPASVPGGVGAGHDPVVIEA